MRGDGFTKLAMDLLVALLRALVPLFALIAIGVGLRRWAVIAHEHVPVLNGLVLNVLLPAAIILGLAKAPTLGPQMLLLPFLLFVSEAILLGVLALLLRQLKMKPEYTGAILLTGIFGNTAFLGYPITQALLPRQFPSAVMIDEFGMMVALYPFAAWLGGKLALGHEAEQKDPRAAIVQFLKGPLFWSIVIGITINLAEPLVRPQMPAWSLTGAKMVVQILGYLAAGTTPVVLIALGIALHPGRSEGDGAALVIASLGKLVLLPLIALGLSLVTGIHGESRAILVLQAGMPSGVLTSILSRQYGFDGRFAVKLVCLATALSLISLPLLMLIAR